MTAALSNTGNALSKAALEGHRGPQVWRARSGPRAEGLHANRTPEPSLVPPPRAPSPRPSWAPPLALWSCSLCGHSFIRDEAQGCVSRPPVPCPHQSTASTPKLSARPWRVTGVGDWVWTSHTRFSGRLRAALDCSRSLGLPAVLWAEVLGVQDPWPQPAVRRQ